MSEADNTTNTSGAPLAGRSVVVTRTKAQAAQLAEPLEALGAEVLEFPVLETVDPEDWGPADAAIADLASYDWIVFTSTNGVERFLKRFKAVGGSTDALFGASFGAVGSATAHKMRTHGLPPTIVPEDFRAEGLVDAFREMECGPGCRVLVPRAAKAREVFPDALREMGVQVDVVTVYRTVPAEPNPAVLERLKTGSVDCVTFTSGAIAEAFIAALRGGGLDPDAVLRGVVVASIGPVTTHALAALGYEAQVEAESATMSALAEAVATHYQPAI